MHVGLGGCHHDDRASVTGPQSLVVRGRAEIDPDLATRGPSRTSYVGALTSFRGCV